MVIAKAGSQPFWMSVKRSVSSFRCVVRTAALVMMDVAYWNGLQMLQYSSPGAYASGSATYCVPVLPVEAPRDVVIEQLVADRARGGRRDGELVDRVDRAVAEVPRVVVVEKVVVALLAVGVHVNLVQVRRDFLDARLGLVRAVAVGAARVPVLRVPVVRTGLRIRVLDLESRRDGRVAVAVAVPVGVAGAERDVVCAGAALDRLVEVVAHRVRVRERLEVRHVALQDVVEAHRRRAFLRRLVVEGRGLRDAVVSGSDGRSRPTGRESAVQPEGFPKVACSTLQSSCCHIS